MKMISKAYWHRKYYAWLKKRTSLIWAWQYSRERYYDQMGRKLCYRHPDDINQKLMWLNRYSNDPRRTHCADKYLVRDYVNGKGFENLLVPLLGVWDDAGQIDFEAFPNKFVLKCNHGSGYNVICTDKQSLDFEETRRKLNVWMSSSYDVMLQEKHYRSIKPLIICEAFLEHGEIGVVDYKFHCFKGKVHSCLVAYNRSLDDPHTVCLDHYDIDWNITEGVKPEYHKCRRLINKPNCYGEMVRICAALSSDFDYVRVDLYEVLGKIYFGEMTFTPAGCIMSYYTQEMLYELGRQLALPDKPDKILC